ncbi:hypothetical protein DPMN_160804 [Dreissena polymorpha]|uniref:Uncharacterized protein n=1 Tax=Dreissena polymorpha TaxID=45954 RepID=A0A9D4ERY0_DREPO|nr:hypothetical protein DPMN_160804 [Dreissena polymorpha]
MTQSSQFTPYSLLRRICRRGQGSVRGQEARVRLVGGERLVHLQQGLHGEVLQAGLRPL